MGPSQSVFLKCANSNSGFELEIIWKQISGPDQKTFKVFKEKVFYPVTTCPSKGNMCYC